MKKGANEIETPDISQTLMSSLARIEAKVDEQASNFSRINERLAKIEAKQETQASINSKVEELYSAKDQGVGIKNFIVWFVATAIALFSYFKF